MTVEKRQEFDSGQSSVVSLFETRIDELTVLIRDKISPACSPEAVTELWTIVSQALEQAMDATGTNAFRIAISTGILLSAEILDERAAGSIGYAAGVLSTITKELRSLADLDDEHIEKMCIQRGVRPYRKRSAKATS